MKPFVPVNGQAEAEAVLSDTSSDLKVLVGDLHKSGLCMYVYGFANVP